MGNQLGALWWQMSVKNARANSYLAAPSLNLTPEEKRVFGQLFRQADTENIGVVTGEVAVKFFEKTRLEPRVLGEVNTTRATDCAKWNRRYIMWRLICPLDMADCR